MSLTLTMNIKETEKFLPIISKTKLRPLLIGHTGIGKTELFKFLAEKEGKDLIIIHVAQLEPQDLIGLYKIITDKDGEGNEVYRTMTCPPTWLPYKQPSIEIIKNGIPSGNGFINPKGGWVFLDEVNRGHKDMRQALYQLLQDKRIHTYPLPDNYNVAASANPSDIYETEEFDRALISRFAWIKFKPQVEETLNYLNAKHGKDEWTYYVEQNRDLLDYGAEDFDPTADFTFSPKILENAKIVWKELKKESKEFKRKALSTFIKKELVEGALRYFEDLEQVSYLDIIQGKNQTKLTEMIAKKRLDVLGTISNNLADVFATYDIGKSTTPIFSKKAEKEVIERVTNFFVTCPPEVILSFADALPATRLEDPRSLLNNEYFLEKLGAVLAHRADKIKV